MRDMTCVLPHPPVSVYAPTVWGIGDSRVLENVAHETYCCHCRHRDRYVTVTNTVGFVPPEPAGQP
jgi:hypothetical protein